MNKTRPYPEFADVLFSLKTFIAAMLALAIALCFDLDNPYWAVGSVYIVAHPLSGASTSKAVYRLLGTAIGGTMTVILLPNLANSPEILTLAISLWMGICLAIALLDRTPRSYVFMLAGYTTALTGFPIVATPDTAFTYATARVIEIGVAIICTALVSRLLMPRHAGPVLAGRIDAWLKDGAALARATLGGTYQEPKNTALIGRLSADAVDLHAFTTHVAYDTSSHRDMVGLARTLQRRMVALLPIISGVADVLATLPQATINRPDISRLIETTSEWISSNQPLSADQQEAFRALMTEAENDSSGRPQWEQLLIGNVVARLRDLIQIWSDCLDLKGDITSGSRHDLRWNRYGPSLDRRPMHKDYGMAAYSALVAMLSTCIATSFWILTAWPQGSGASMMAAVACCLFASMDDPTPAIRGFLVASLAAVGAAFVLEFGLFPMLHSYWSLAAALGFVFIPAGILMARPQTMLLGLAFGVNLANMLSLQSRLSLDLTTFVNSNTGLIIGLGIACGTTAMVRSVGAEWSARRLLRAGWADIAAAARRNNEHDVTGLLHRMVDRLGLAAPRLAAFPAEAAVTPNDVLKDLRSGLNVVDLQRFKPLLGSNDRAAVDRVLSEVADHYRAKRNSASKPLATLLATLDRSLAILSADEASTAVVGARRALTGLRYNLFPEAPGFVANENRSVAGGDIKEQAA
jgi:uncharacterized membrane protein YccC